MEQNKRIRNDGYDVVPKKLKEEKVERRYFYDMFFFDEGLYCDTPNVEGDTEEQIQERIVDETSDDETTIDKSDKNLEHEAGSDIKEKTDLYEDDSAPNGSSSEEEQENPILTSSEGSSKVIANKGKATNFRNKEDGQLDSSSTSQNDLDQPEIFTDPLCPFKEALQSDLSCMRWLQTQGLIMDSRKCPACGLDMVFKLSKRVRLTRYIWKCRMDRRGGSGKFHPNVIIGAKRGSIFNRNRSSPRQLLIIIYYFSQDRTYVEFLIKETSIKGGTTVWHYLTFLRQLCLMWLLDNCKKDKTLGSPVHPVELVVCDVMPNSSTFTLCFVEHAPSGFNYIVDSCSGRDFESITALVFKYVTDGTRLFSELLKTLYGKKCTHFEVDGDKRRLKPLNLQSCILKESILSKVKKDRRIGLVLKLPSTHLSEYLYRKEVAKMDVDPFWHLLHIIKTYYPVK